MSDDLAAIKRVIAGDTASFRVLVERYQGAVFCMVRNLLPHPNDYEDIAQEVFLAAYTRLGSYDPGRAAFSTWLLTIARNKCLNALKRQKPIVTNGLPEKADQRTPQTNMAEEELSQQLDVALASLPFEQKMAFVLSEVQGFSYEEIGQIEGVSLGTVKSRISRAKEKLRLLLQRAAE